MELKTKVTAPEGGNDVLIEREFELPVELLYRAYCEAELLEQWMGTKVLELVNEKFGKFRFETIDPRGNRYSFRGCLHEVIVNEKIIRTFEFENTKHGVQLEVLHFEAINEDRCKLLIHSIYESNEHRSEALKMPFAYGLSMAHNKLEEILTNNK